MQKGIFEGSPPFSLLIMLLFTMVACFLTVMFTGILFVPPVFGVPVTELPNVLNGSEIALRLSLMRYLQILQSISLFIIPAFLAAYLFSGHAAGYLGLRQPVAAKWFWAVLLMILTAAPLINLMAALNEMIVLPKSLAGLEQWLRSTEEELRKTTLLFLNVDTVGGMFFNIFMIAMLPALGEELIFRGLLHKILVLWTGNVHLTIIVTGFLFSLMHLQFYGFFPRWLLGVVFGYLFVWSGTIWAPIFAHFVNNAVAVLIFWLIHKGMIPESFEHFGTASRDIPVILVTTVICVFLLWKMYRYSTSATQTPNTA